MAHRYVHSAPDTSSLDPVSARVYAVGEWIVEHALPSFSLEELLSGACEKLVEMGMPVVRSHISMNSLHPMFRSMYATWSADGQLQVFHHAFAQDEPAAWHASPLKVLLESGEKEMRYRLEVAGEWERYPVLREFRDAGGTDYLALVLPFADIDTALRSGDGMLMSWVFDKPGGLDGGELKTMRIVSSLVALAGKIAKREQTAQNIVSAYLGSSAGQRVLDGQIRRGDVDVINAIIWYTDLRDSTRLAEALGPELFLSTLNDYFECTASPVLDHGGEVLRFIGDAVLGIFPVHGAEGSRRWARVAMAAMQSARGRMAELNAKRARSGLEQLRFGLGLHVGDVMFGNIGVPERVEFSVVGPAANEAARVESMTKTLGEDVVVSAEFASLVPIEWRDLGEHPLAGVSDERRLFAPM